VKGMGEEMKGEVARMNWPLDIYTFGQILLLFRT